MKQIREGTGLLVGISDWCGDSMTKAKCMQQQQNSNSQLCSLSLGAAVDTSKPPVLKLWRSHGTCLRWPSPHRRSLIMRKPARCDKGSPRTPVFGVSLPPPATPPDLPPPSPSRTTDVAALAITKPSRLCPVEKDCCREDSNAVPGANTSGLGINQETPGFDRRRRLPSVHQRPSSFTMKTSRSVGAMSVGPLGHGRAIRKHVVQRGKW